MPRGITEKDVWSAADALLLEGARPTIERVRQKIGRGSPNTVSPYLDTWFKNLGGRIKDPGAFSAPPELPDPVHQAAKHLWESALAETRRDFDERFSEAMAGVVVLFVQIGALCSENPLHDKHLRFRHFRALHPFRADWCALAPVAV